MKHKKGIALVAAGISAGAIGHNMISQPSGSESPKEPIAVKEYVVRPQDTLWGIIQRSKVGGDIRELVFNAEQSMHEKGKGYIGDVLTPGMDKVLLPADSKIGHPAEAYVNKDSLPVVTNMPEAPQG